ncbi:MAG: hypothetical protein CMM87_03430 [Rickettsiales bacterium]|nr:hypothetical protein [Rickettsiales bacterium]|tara:strand:+ start:23437 stop:24522 length:1086 start_codon:yes stop_codon:yes gene_type:complete
MVLFSYIFRQYLKWLSVVALAFSSIVILMDFFELFRRAKNKPDIGFTVISKMVFFHFPDILKQLMPLIALFASLILFLNLGRSSQLVIMRMSGSSLRRLLIPLFAVISLYAFFDFLFLNSISAQLMQKFESYNNRLFKGNSSAIRLSSSGLWLRESQNNQYTIVQIKHIQATEKKLQNLSFFIFSNENTLLNRIDAEKAIITQEGWVLKNATLLKPNREPEKIQSFIWRTDLDLDSIEKQSLGPDTISFWKLKNYISILKKAGLSSVKYEMIWHSTLAQPFLILTMAFLGAFVSFWAMQRRMNIAIVLVIILFAYAIYVLFNVVGAMGRNYTIPVFLAAWAPPMMSLFFTSALLLHYEEKV